MELAAETIESTPQTPVRFDVLIVGAGISGIDAAYHLQQECPDKSFALLESQATFGGTWNTHKFPGIRSDSDLYTYGYSWKPWSSAPIATAEEILTYLDEVLDEQNIRRHIHFHHDVKSARWSSEDKCWTLEVERNDTGEKLRFACNFLWMCQGYYRHSEGYTPDFPGVERFRGQIVHPSPGRKTSIIRARLLWSSGRARRRPHWFRRWRNTLPTSPCCSVRQPIISRRRTVPKLPICCGL